MLHVNRELRWGTVLEIVRKATHDDGGGDVRSERPCTFAQVCEVRDVMYVSVNLQRRDTRAKRREDTGKEAVQREWCPHEVLPDGLFAENVAHSLFRYG